MNLIGDEESVGDLLIDMEARFRRKNTAT